MLVASVVARAPNFVLPILAIRILDFSSYSIFAIGFAAAGSMSSFLGEAIAATISRESFRTRQGVEGSSSLSRFFRSSLILAHLLIVVLVCLYWLFSTGVESDSKRAWLAAMATILLTPAYLMPATTTALANAHGRGNVSTVATLVGVPASITFSLLVGAQFGVLYFLLSYFLSVVLTNSVICIKVVPVFGLDRSQRLIDVLRDYGPILLAVLVPFLLGGPVHGLCLFILGHAAYGSTELATFVAYYPWSAAVSVFAAILANYVIQSVVEIKQLRDTTVLRNFTVKLLLVSVVVAISVSALLWCGVDLVFILYGPYFEPNKIMFGWMLVCGLGLALISTTSQVLIGVGSRRGLVSCAILHAFLYVGLCLLFVDKMGLGALGLARSLSYSLFVLALVHLMLIARYIRFGFMMAHRVE